MELMNLLGVQVQCDAIRWEQFLRRCRVRQIYRGIQKTKFQIKYIKENMFRFYMIKNKNFITFHENVY